MIDLDKDRFEIYKGFNHTPLIEGERFKSESANSDGYYPVQLIAAYPFNNLPTGRVLKELEEKATAE